VKIVQFEEMEKHMRVREIMEKGRLKTKRKEMNLKRNRKSILFEDLSNETYNVQSI